MNKIRRKLKKTIPFYTGHTRPHPQCVVVFICTKTGISNWRVSRKARKNGKETTNCHEDRKTVYE